MIKNLKIFAVIATALFISWLVLVLNLRGFYVNISGIAPLGMINLLFPYFWVILVAFITVCFLTFKQRDSPRWLHILLLAQLSLILYYTPFLLGGFSWSPDSLWHGGVADYLPSILSGSKLPLTEYAQSYPLSFLITYGIRGLFSIDIVTYTLYVFPPICTVLITTFAYQFSQRIFNNKTAFMAMLLVLPSLHYIEPHVSPFALGTVLLLASLVLLTYKGAKAIVFSLLLIVAVTLTHPISPIFLGIYLSVALLVNLLSRENSESFYSVAIFANLFHNGKHRISLINRNVLRLLLLLLFLGAIWYYWTVYQAAPNYIGVKTPVSKIFDLSFITNLVHTFEWTTSGQGFIYPQISQLSLFVYALFLVGIITIFMSNLLKFLRHREKVGESIPSLLTLTLTAIGSGVMSYLLFSSSGERFLLGRGLIFFLLMGSICIATYLAGDNIRKSNLKIAFAFVFVLFLVCTFPLISYSKEAYNTFTPSAEAGLIFLSENIDLSQKTLSMTSDQQLAAYADLTKGLNLIGFPPDLSHQKPDVVVLRVNSYYLLSMRYDLSLTQNSYTRLCANLTDNQLYDKVYSNAEFEIYVHSF